jgi:Family of unknown function (DUF5681)
MKIGITHEPQEARHPFDQATSAQVLDGCSMEEFRDTESTARHEGQANVSPFSTGSVFGAWCTATGSITTVRRVFLQCGHWLMLFIARTLPGELLWDLDSLTLVSSRRFLTETMGTQWMTNPAGNPSNLIPFRPGQSGNPSGKPNGARNRITARFLHELASHFDEHGARSETSNRELRKWLSASRRITTPRQGQSDRAWQPFSFYMRWRLRKDNAVYGRVRSTNRHGAKPLAPLGVSRTLRAARDVQTPDAAAVSPHRTAPQD